MTNKIKEPEKIEPELIESIPNNLAETNQVDRRYIITYYPSIAKHKGIVTLHIWDNQKQSWIHNEWLK